MAAWLALLFYAAAVDTQQIELPNHSTHAAGHDTNAVMSFIPGPSLVVASGSSFRSQWANDISHPGAVFEVADCCMRYKVPPSIDARGVLSFLSMPTSETVVSNVTVKMLSDGVAGPVGVFTITHLKSVLLTVSVNEGAGLSCHVLGVIPDSVGTWCCSDIFKTAPYLEGGRLCFEPHNTPGEGTVAVEPHGVVKIRVGRVNGGVHPSAAEGAERVRAATATEREIPQDVYVVVKHADTNTDAAIRSSVTTTTRYNLTRYPTGALCTTVVVTFASSVDVTPTLIRGLAQLSGVIYVSLGAPTGIGACSNSTRSRWYVYALAACTAVVLLAVVAFIAYRTFRKKHTKAPKSERAPPLALPPPPGHPVNPLNDTFPQAHYR
eukprot:TRINITY_DN22737_c0_g1_i1.p1 TRINITY_DN22737_c0_g1~~TRINITY_DN22737_c0_g1_i1.p1  ORF type:complete len:379 (+),score=46.29 TRINITY_DN22737_c0_g1_i1:31-1167(+)